MEQKLHLVFDGELVDPTKNVFKDIEALHVVGIFSEYEKAFDAWKAEAQKTVDNAHMRYFITDLGSLLDEGAAGRAAQDLG